MRVSVATAGIVDEREIRTADDIGEALRDVMDELRRQGEDPYSYVYEVRFVSN